MRVLIEEYRGWEIFFDTENEDFYTTSNEYDRQQSKRSYASTKKYIDDFLKENLNFKPFKIQRVRTYFSNEDTLEVVGMTKHGVFIYIDRNGKRVQLSKYSEGEYFKQDPINESVFKAISQLYEKNKEIEKMIREESLKLKKVSLDEIRNNIMGL
jgi:hypothetical protein